MTAPHDTPRTDERAGLSEAERFRLSNLFEGNRFTTLCDEVERIIADRLAAAVAERDAALARVAAVEALHYRCGPSDSGGYCRACVLDWPCPTIAALAAPVSADLSDRGEVGGDE